MKLGENLLNIGGDEPNLNKINIIGRNSVTIQLSNATTTNRLEANTINSLNNMSGNYTTQLR